MSTDRITKSQQAYKSIKEFADMLVRTYCIPTKDGYLLNYDQITEHDLLKLCGLFMQIDEEKYSLESEILFDGTETFPRSLREFLLKSNEQNTENLKNTIINNVLKYYEERIRRILDASLENAEHEDNFDRNKVLKRSRETGDAYYAKR